MRRLVLLLAVLFCCAPAFALDWHVDMTAGVNDDSNLEARVDWHVERFYFELQGRHTDYGEAMAVNGTRIGCGRLSPALLDYDAGLQWRAAAWYRAFESHGPAVAYTRVSDLDATWFLGWHFGIGSSE